MNPCKRRGVLAVGKDKAGNIDYAYNGNKGECSGTPITCGCDHAEKLLLEKMKPATVWVSLAPCIDCAKLLLDSGVEWVYFEQTYYGPSGVDLLKERVAHEQVWGD